MGSSTGGTSTLPVEVAVAAAVEDDVEVEEPEEDDAPEDEIEPGSVFSAAARAQTSAAKIKSEAEILKSMSSHPCVSSMP
jgi:hypothetical protein